MPDGKPAGVRCAQLTDDNRCRLFGLPERPAFCVGLRPSAEMCGETREAALVYLEHLELLTQPTPLNHAPPHESRMSVGETVPTMGTPFHD